MSGSDGNHYNEDTYLLGDQWVLTVYKARRGIPEKKNICYSEKIEITASYDSIEFWNRQFGKILRKDEATLLERVQASEGIVVSTSFPFRPTTSLKNRYGTLL